MVFLSFLVFEVKIVFSMVFSILIIVNFLEIFNIFRVIFMNIAPNKVS
jgi:hypothetical protein